MATRHATISQAVSSGNPKPGTLLAPSVEAASPLSSEPQAQADHVFEFEVQSPSELKVGDYDAEDELAVPLMPYTKDFIHENFPVPPDVVDIDPNDFDVPKAVKRYGYKFDLDTSAPKRRALLVGIKGDSLKGPHNDVKEMKSLLLDVYGWNEDDIMVLKDDDPSSPLYPIRQTVLDHLFILIHNARANDHLFIHFSGHGSQIEDLDGDESDGLDEVICCADGKIIVDDQLHDILVKPLPRHCRLVALFDCCASGTGLDLVKTPGQTPSASPQMRAQELQFNATFAGGALDLPHSLQAEQKGELEGFGSISQGETGGRKKYSEGDVVMWSACLDSADSHEIKVNDGYNGAMSHAFTQCIRHKPAQSYQHLLEAIIAKFRVWKVPQQPQLTSAQKLDRNATFTI